MSPLPRYQLAGMPLTAVERQTLTLAAEGLTVAEISGRLNAPPDTVRSRLAQTYAKLEVAGRNARVAAVLKAAQAGLITLPGVPPMPTAAVFAVITRVPDHANGEAGNLATGAGQVLVETEQPGPVNGYRSKVVPLPARVSFATRLPVFVLGEIVILNEPYGREVCGAGRKPSKWDVDVEHFHDLDTAIRRARAVVDDAAPVGSLPGDQP